MYWFIGSIVGAVVGYNLSEITFDDIHNAQAFAHEFSGNGGKLMGAFGVPSADDLTSKLSAYVLGFSVLGMIVGGFIKPLLSKHHIQQTLDVVHSIKDLKPCPHCAEDIKTNAKFCRYCKREI